MVRGVSGRGDGVGWREFFCVLFFCFVFVLSVVRSYRILAYAMIVSLWNDVNIYFYEFPEINKFEKIDRNLVSRYLS